MKALEMFIDFLFHQPALGVLVHNLLEGQLKVIGNDQCWLNPSAAVDRHLTDVVVIAFEEADLLMDLQEPAFAVSRWDLHVFPLGLREGLKVFDNPFAASANGDELDRVGLGIELFEVLIGREATVKNKILEGFFTIGAIKI